jgi:hypothetical protein
MQLMETLKGGGAKGDALKGLLQQRLQGVMGKMAPDDPKRQWVADVLAGKPVNKDALLAANPGLLQNLGTQSPELLSLLLKSDPTLQGAPAAPPPVLPRAPAPIPQPAPQAPLPASPGVKEQFWGHMAKVGETADRAFQAAQVAAEGVQRNAQQVQELRGAVDQVLTAQQQINDTIRQLPQALADMMTKPTSKEGSA